MSSLSTKTTNSENSGANDSKMPVWSMNEEIVISGIAGRFPESDNIDELKQNLYNNVDMISEDAKRWPSGLYGLPTRSGKIKDLGKFDAEFFGVNGKQANHMDPQSRLLLELTYEAIADSGFNPEVLRGTKTGVYVGAFRSEQQEGLTMDTSKLTGYTMTGCCVSMFSNRISYAFDFHGPCYTVDTACSSSFVALNQAVLGLRTGQCDMAVVGGVSICINPATALQFHRLNMTSIDGKCKFLDIKANGYVRSETCSVILLQKKSEAKRIYATVLHTNTNIDGYKTEGITYPKWQSQSSLMRTTLTEAGIKPSTVGYIEAHGTGTPAGDPCETSAIYDVFCNGVDRKEPLLIGGVKSNLGHSEHSSGLCSLAKVLITFENKSIPANLHFETPNPNIPSLISGEIKPVVKNTPFIDGVVAVNSFGFGGVNVHILLKPHQKEISKDSTKIVESIPRLIPICGRTEESVAHILDFIDQNPKKVTRDLLALLFDVSQTTESSGMSFRGYLLARNAEQKTEENAVENILTFSRDISRVTEKKPVWFVFPGMGCQWTAMAKGMMDLDVFRKSIERSAKFLKRFGFDLFHAILSDDSQALSKPVSTSVSIIAIQIALIDFLRVLGVEPDGMVGHSMGELGCGYADGALDAEQTLLFAYWRGKCVEDIKTPKCLMVAVGLSWEEAKRLCPEGVVAACHNSEDSVTISGPYEITFKFMEELKAENIFAREVSSNNLAFHSYFMELSAQTFAKKLKNAVPAKLRSSRWISSSVAESQWNEDSAKYSTAEYYANNSTQPVLFHEAVQHIPKNAIVIEIGPHCLFQSIVKRSLGPNITHIPLMKRNNNSENLDLLMSSAGKLYMLGLNPRIDKLYPNVEYPVARGTQSISPLIRWDHSQDWLVTLFPEYFNPSSSSDYTLSVDLNEKEDEYYAGHCIDGRILFPATGYLMLVWKMLAKTKGQSYDKIRVKFENVTLHRATILPIEGKVKFIIRIMESSGDFSVTEGGNVVATGRVVVDEESNPSIKNLLNDSSVRSSDSLKLEPKDIYKELRIRGYDYGKTFQGLVEATADGRHGKIKYTGSWVAFVDAMLQLSILGKSSRGLYLPVRFQSIRVDPQVFDQAIEESGDNPVLEVVSNPRINVCTVRGIEIRGLKTNLAPRRQGVQKLTIEKYRFVPYYEEKALEKQDFDYLNQYIQVCSSLTQKVLQSSEESSAQIQNLINRFEEPDNVLEEPDNVLKEYLMTPEEQHIILKVLEELMTFDNKVSLKENLSKVINKYGNELSKDLVSNVYLNQYLLRPALDVVLENCSSSKLKVLEVNSSPIILFNRITSLINTSGYYHNLTYTLAHSSPNNITEDLGETKIVEWNVSESRIPSESSTIDLVIYKDSSFNTEKNLDLQSLTESLYSITKSNGFVIALLRTQFTPAELFIHKYTNSTLKSSNAEEFIINAEKTGFSVISNRTDSLTSSVILLRKIVTKKALDQSIVTTITRKYDPWVESLKDGIKEHQTEGNVGNVWLVAEDSPLNGVVGLVNCLRREPSGDKIRCFFNITKSTESRKSKLMREIDENFYSNILKNDLVMNVYRNEKLGSFRHFDMDLSNESVMTEHAYLNVQTKGDLSSLRWFEAQHKFWPTLPAAHKKSEVLCNIYYAPLNFRDIMLATGKLPPDALPGDMALQDCILGLEFAGRDQSGNRVMGMIASKALATTVIVDDPEFLWPIPTHWSMEEASTVPVVYGTAYYALIVRGGLESGESVLIHSGSGGVGQAAISIALSMGCEVYTTVGSLEKKEFLKKEFPQLTDRNISNSRDTSFEEDILSQTDGKGVDVVLNSLSEEKLQASVRCLAQHGRFLEIGKYDLSQNNPLGMSAFLKNIEFKGILLDALFGPSSGHPTGISAQKLKVAKLVREGIKSGAVKPLKRTIFRREESEKAFRYMASGKHIGKVVLKIREEERDNVVPPKPLKIEAIPQTAFHPLKSYIVTGGLGGIALELDHWMVERGARKIVVSSRSGLRNAYQHYCINRLRSKGANVIVSKADATTPEGATQLIKEAQSLGPVGGIFNLAMVMNDAFIENQSSESFRKVCSSKIDSTVNLNDISRRLCPELEYFVAFSSVSCGRGNAGQSNYGFANSAQERVCELRRRDGLHGLAVQWGTIADVGLVSESPDEIHIDRVEPQRIHSCLSTFDRFLQSNETVCCCLVNAAVQPSGVKQFKTSNKKENLINRIANILGVRDYEKLSPNTTLSEMGLDSLMSVEIRQTLEREYQLTLTIKELRSLDVRHLIEMSSHISTKSGSK